MRRHVLLWGFMAASLVATVPAAQAMIDPVTRQPLYAEGHGDRVAVPERPGRRADVRQNRAPRATVQQASLTRRAASPIARETVAYQTSHAPGTVVVNTGERRLYLVLAGGQALRYGIGVGRDGFQWSGTHRVSRKAEWPSWTPPSQMLQRQPNLPRFMPGGPNNPLGARALYIGSTLYRIHGSNEPWSIGQAVSSGCIRMANDDVIDLYTRVKVGAKVVVVR